MALWHPFRPKQVGKGRESGQIKIIVPITSDPTRNREFQKNSKKIQKIRSAVMTSFLAKIVWEMQRES